MRYTIFKAQILILLLFCAQTMNAQLSSKHFIPPITTSDNIGNQYIYISTPKNQNISFTITPIGGVPISGIVSNASPYIHEIEVWELGESIQNNDSQLHQNSAETNTVINSKGFIIEAEDVIYVSVRVRQAFSSDGNSGGFQSGALVSKGLAALGTIFRVGGFVDEGPTPTNYLTFVSVMATENNTTVTFNNTNTGIVIENGGTGAFPFNATLNEGESYIVAVRSPIGNPNDLIGTLVTSDNPIVVNSGSANGSFYFNGGRDYGIDQIVDFSKVGNEYIFVRGDGDDGWENALIVAHQDNTTIAINGSPVIKTINSGEYYVIEGDQYSANGNMYVQTSNPVFAYQGVGGDGSARANQGLFFVPPLSCENRGDVNKIANIDKVGNDTFTGEISIVTNKGAVITINDQPISSFSAVGPFDVTGNTDYVTYKVRFLTGDVKITSTEELYCAYFNRNNFASSGSFYSGFPSSPEISFNLDLATLGNCIPNITLNSPNSNVFDSFEWFFDDGSGFVATGNTTDNINPTQAGKYKLVGTLACSGSSFDSQVIPVSLCPDDFDNDLIIDNLDVDIDNDGILNCDESSGNVNLDLTNTNTPVLNFIDNSTNSSFITTTLNQVGSSTLVGDISGVITSTIDAATNSELNYELVFNKSSNVSFIQNPSLTHTIVSGEVFIIIIGPSTKNITLVDPDNILLVDTNFDGVFETDVNFFSASEIRYTYNPNPNGTTPFKFVANTIDQITFKHTLSNVTDSSTFSGVLSLTCFDIDNDNDGMPDSFDVDSDNDGIPDSLEKSGLLVTLLGTDANNDGLDDAFNLTDNPIDTDGDGVLDYLDLDSDNDGIFDLEETAADTDADTIFNYLDLDSDNDTCNDVIEAGFTDPNSDGTLGNSPITVDVNGKVTSGTDGYTTPNTNYITAAPIELNTTFVDVAFCEASTSIITIDSTADSFQWELSTDGINWSTITDNTIYNGATTTSLQITNIQLAYSNYKYRVFLQRTGNSCNETSNEITLSVSPLPIITASIELKQCDNDTDGFSNFNLFEAASDISTNHANETFVFYPTLADANGVTNAFTSNESIAFTNRTQTTDTVWARTFSDFGCSQGVTEVNLTVSTTGIPSTFQREFTACDDFLDIDGNNTANNDDTDGVATFDFSSVTAEIIAIFPANQQLDITYYRNEADALAEQNAITDPSSYRNIGYANSQDIYIRVDSQLDNDCLGFGAHITLNVNPVPTSIKPDDLELCDDFDDGNGLNGIVQTFNLDSQTTTILDGQNPAYYSVTYHLTATDANTGANPIGNTSTYENTIKDLQSIYVRVENNTTNCFNDHVSFDLIVHPLPIANFVEDLEICDDATDGSARNGFSQSFDLELQTAGVLDTQDPAIYTVTYHSSLSDAQNNLLPFGSPFTNTVVNRQTIYVRVFNETTQCANGISNFDVIVNPEPFTENISNLSYCDDDTDQDDTNGIVQKIDLNSQVLPILGASQNVADFDVTFYLSGAEATNGINALSSPFENTIPDQQTIYVRVEDKRTGCVNDDLTFDVIVNPLPIFEVNTPSIVCLNGPELTIEAENSAAVYTYEWLAPDGTITTERTLTVTSGGLYTITATTTNGTACSRTRTVQVNESIIAAITEEDVTIIDDSDNNSISIDNSNNNLGIGDYEFALYDTNGNVVVQYQDEPLFEGLDGGIYRILVRDKNGCGVASVEVPVVTFPKFFTPNNDGENDTWSLKGVNTTFFPSSKIYIFNRYGKVVADIHIGTAWDGTDNEKKLPSNDYWFNAVLEDINGNIRKKSGHFSLLRK